MVASGLLAGIRVLDMSHSVAGPYCGTLLGYFGAEVIKLEPPQGEPMRGLGSDWEVNWVVILANQNKKGITLNLNTSKGRDLFRELVPKVDVLLESFIPGTMQRNWGLDYPMLAELNPRLVYAAVTGFGSDNAYSNVAAYDMSIQAMSGWMAASGPADGPPVLTAAAPIDFGSAFLALSGVLAALWTRERTGKGQRIEISMRDIAVASNLVPNRIFVEKGLSVQRFGNQSWGMSPGNVYRTKDGWVYLRAMRDEQAEHIFHLIGRGDLCHDIRFNGRAARWRNRVEIDRIVTEFTETKTKREVFDLLTSHDIQCAVIMEPGEALRDQELEKRGAVLDIEQPAVGHVRVTNPNLMMSGIDFVPPGPAPVLPGEHNFEVYQALLGLAEDKIVSMREEGII